MLSNTAILNCPEKRSQALLESIFFLGKQRTNMDYTVKPTKRACFHLLESKDANYYQRFADRGLAYDLICAMCKVLPADIEADLRDVDVETFEEIEREGCWEGIVGEPAILIRDSSLHFEHRQRRLLDSASLQFLDIQPVITSADIWLAVTSAGDLVRLDTNCNSIRVGPRVPNEVVDIHEKVLLRTTRNGQLAVAVNARGQRGVVLDVESGQVMMMLNRDSYHEDVSTFPVAFIELEDQTLLIHGTAWNRLDVSDVRTAKLLTDRSPTSYKRGEDRPPHYLDYFHCELSVSPGQQFVADNGWVWHPVGLVATWNISRWLQENIWESEDGPSKKYFCQRAYCWDGPLCWIDDQHLAVWGYGGDDEWLIPAACIFNVMTGKLVRWFPGPMGSMVADDGHLFSWNTDGTSVWDLTTGERLAIDSTLCPVGYHHLTKCFLTVLGDGNYRLSRLANHLNQA
jgi:hypothetical protein